MCSLAAGLVHVYLQVSVFDLALRFSQVLEFGAGALTVSDRTTLRCQLRICLRIDDAVCLKLPLLDQAKQTTRLSIF